MARRKLSQDQKQRQRREWFQRKYIHKKEPYDSENDKESARFQFNMVESVQHAVVSDDACYSKEQLEIEKGAGSELITKNYHRNTNRNCVKRKWEEPDDKRLNNEKYCPRNSSEASSYKTCVNNDIDSVLTNVQISDRKPDLNECEDYKDNSSTELLTRRLGSEDKSDHHHDSFEDQPDGNITQTVEAAYIARTDLWIGAHDVQSVGESHDFDGLFRSWCENEGLDISTKCETVNSSNEEQKQRENLNKLREWIRDNDIQSLHKSCDFDGPFRSWCDNEQLGISTNYLTVNSSNDKQKQRENKEGSHSLKRAHTSQHVTDCQTVNTELKTNEMVHFHQKSLDSYNANEIEKTCIREKPSKMKNTVGFMVESFPDDTGTDELSDRGSYSSVCGVSELLDMNTTRSKQSCESSLDPNIIARRKATINMVNDTYIPDDVIMEAFSIMQKHSPHLAPYIGQLPPAMQHLLRNAKETALLPYIPSNKISINIHHIDGHWITSVFKPQTNTVYVYDSLRLSNRISRIRKDLTILYGANLNIQYPMVTQQGNTLDCGAFAIAFAFSALLGIPPETQIYDTYAMRSHLKVVLQSGNLIPFPVTRESSCLADYFSTQSKMLSKNQNQSGSAELLTQNRNCMKRESLTRRQYFTDYMSKRRGKETENAKQLRIQKNKEHMQVLRSQATSVQIRDRNKKNKEHMQTFRSQATSVQIRDRNKKNKEHMQTFRSQATSVQRQDRNKKNKEHMQTYRSHATSVQRQDRNKKNKEHMQILRNHATAKQKCEYNEIIKQAMKMARNKESNEMKQKRNSKSKKYMEDLIKKETLTEREIRKMKIKMAMKKLRSLQTSNNKTKDKLKDKKRKQLLQKLHLEQKTYDNECETFKLLSRDGPKYVCTVCRRLLYKQGVKNSTSQTFSKTSLDLLKLCFTGKVSSYVCLTCCRYLASNRLPPMSVANKMSLKQIPECLHDLTELEERLVAQRIPFMKIMNLPMGKQKAIIGQVVNVPVDTAETVAALPRTANSSGFIPLKLKRKQAYSGHVLYQMIRPHKVEAALKYLVENNEHYKNILLNKDWQKNFQTEDQELWDALIEPPGSNIEELSDKEVHDKRGSDPSMASNGEKNSTGCLRENSTGCLSEVEVNETKKSTPNSNNEEESLRGLQYNTCIQPDDLANYLGNEVYSVAPGEGRLPLLVANDVNNEVLTFPTLYPDGKFGFDVQRLPKLTLRKYFQARLLSEDTRFARNTEYLFYAQYLSEQKQISDSINIALRKAKLSVTEQDKVTAGALKNSDRLKQIILQDQGQRFLQNVRGSPAYCRKLLSDLLAMIRQLGPFTFFLTLSAADLRWPDTICVVASQYNVTLTDEDVKNMSWEERCHWIRRNPVTVARQFDYRVQLFVKHILGSGVIGEIDDYLYRVEFQRRGSPHIHMVIWIQDAPNYSSGSDEEIADFVDKHISCSLPDDDDDLREKVNALQRHVHSSSCTKKGKTCRYSFPRPPSNKTIICRGASSNPSPNEQSAETVQGNKPDNDSADKQDERYAKTPKNQNKEEILNEQSKGKKQGETNKCLNRKTVGQSQSTQERSSNIVNRNLRKKKKSIFSNQTEDTDTKDKSDTKKRNKEMPVESVSHQPKQQNNKWQPKKQLQKEQEITDKSQHSGKHKTKNSKTQPQLIPEINLRSNVDDQNNIHKMSTPEQEPLSKEKSTHSGSPPSEQQPDSQTESQSATEQKAVLNKMFEAMYKLDITYDTTLEDILLVAEISQEAYEQALANSKSSNGIILKRRPCEYFINNYNSKILRVWGANMDIQYVSCPYGCVMYVSSYVTKPEHEMSELLEQTSKQAADCDIRQQLHKVGSKFLSSREISAQEAAYRVLSLPLSRSSREVLHVSTDPPSERLHLLKPMSVIQTLEDDDEDIFQIGLVERYMKRPAKLNNICLAEFASVFRVDYKKMADQISGTSCDILEENKNSEITIKLQDDLGFMKKRTRPAVIRTYKHSLKKCPEKYYHSMLMLYYPWRTEESLLQYGDGSFEIMYHTVQQIVSDNQSKFEKHAEIVEAAVQNLEDFGPPEDAWAEIAAESEHDREKQRAEGSRSAEEFAYIDPEVHLEASHAAAGGVNLLQKVQAWVMEDPDYQTLIQSLNLQQRQVFCELYKWCFDIITSRKTGKVPEPILTFISGCAGTGKSHLIKALYQAAIKTLRPEAESPDDIVCLLTAPTSPAAYNINGQTLHSAFSLPHHAFDLSISQSRLSYLRNKLSSLFILIIDEISMVGSDMLFTIHKRLSEIKGTTNKLFGGVSVVVFGDLSQLPPVGQFPVYKLPKNKMARLYGTVWNEFNGFELTEIMRQQEDKDFANLLKRVRSNKLTHEDKKQLESRVINRSDPNYPSDAVHVFATNKLVDDYNAVKLSQLRSTIYEIKSEDTTKEINTGAISLDIPEKDSETGGLRQTIQLAIGARVMIPKNVSTTDGLVNGMMGTVVGFHPPPSPADTEFRPVFVLVQLDDPKAGLAARRKYRSILIDWPDATPIVREEVKFKVGKYNVAEVARRQFPLRLAWACTIHKVQGLTLTKIVVSCEGQFRPGQFYVAVSRVRSLSCLYFTSLDFNKVIDNSAASEALNTMLSTRPLLPMPIWLSDLHSLVITCMNVNSLVAHRDSLKCHHLLHSSDILTLTETWLHPTYPNHLKIQGFTLKRSDRALCYTETQLSKQTASFQRHGGVASYIKDEYKLLDSSHPTKDIEYLRIVLQGPGGSKLSIVTVYRPPSQNLTEFLGFLQKVLQTEMEDDATTIVCGDFNVNALESNEQAPFHIFRHYDFLQIVHEPTHIQGACLDHVYIRKPEKLNYRVVPVTFSPHAAVQMQYYF